METSTAQRSTARALISVGVVCTLLFELGVLMAGWRHSLEGNGDFSAFYRTAVMARSGELHSLYSPEKQLTFDRQLFPALHRFPPYYFYHPPYEVLFLLPLAFVSYGAAFWVWTGLLFLLLVLSGYVLEPEFRDLRKGTGIPLFVFVLTAFPTMMIFLQGQDSPVLLLLLALAFRQYERHQDASCGILLGLGLFKFQFIVPLVGFLAFRPRLKLLRAFLATLSALFFLSWTLVGTSGLKLYCQLLGNHTPEVVWRMPNLRGLVETLGGPPVLTLALSVALFVWCGWRVKRMKAGEFALATIGALLVSYHGHVYDNILLVIPVLWMLNRASLTENASWSVWPALLFLTTPVYVLLTRYEATFIFAILFLLLAFAGARALPRPKCYPEPVREALP
jgi:Glycosyltransferase family 87